MASAVGSWIYNKVWGNAEPKGVLFGINRPRGSNDCFLHSFFQATVAQFSCIRNALGRGHQLNNFYRDYAAGRAVVLTPLRDEIPEHALGVNAQGDPDLLRETFLEGIGLGVPAREQTFYRSSLSKKRLREVDQVFSKADISHNDLSLLGKNHRFFIEPEPERELGVVRANGLRYIERRTPDGQLLDREYRQNDHRLIVRSKVLAPSCNIRLSKYNRGVKDIQQLLDLNFLRGLDATSLRMELANEDGLPIDVNVPRIQTKKFYRDAPPLLMITMPRFQGGAGFGNDEVKNDGGKDHTVFNVPSQIKLKAKFVDSRKEDTSYKLRSFTLQNGDIRGGHFVAYRLVSKGNGSYQWYKCDDGITEEVTDEEALLKAGSAYQLFYERRSDSLCDRVTRLVKRHKGKVALVATAALAYGFQRLRNYFGES